MNWISFTAAGIAVYLAIAILVCGVIFHLINCWRQRPRYVRASNATGNGGLLSLSWSEFSLGKKIFVIALLATSLGLFLGHTRIFGDLGLVLNLFGEENLDRIGHILGTGLGIFFFVAVGYLLLRRIASPRKEQSRPKDYLLLSLVLLLVLLGNYLRIIRPFGLEDYRAYMASLVAFSPAFPETIASSSWRWLLTGHVFTASLFFAYLPFSGFVPSIYDFVRRCLKHNQQ